MLSDNDTMKLYMQNIGQFPLVSPEEEIELAAKIKDGDDDAKQKLIRSNLRLVVKIAHDFKGLGLPLLRVDGGPTRNKYLMQFQSDLLDTTVSCPNTEELSAIGAACMAGISCGIYSEKVLQTLGYHQFSPRMDERTRIRKLEGWKNAVKRALI